MTTLQDIDFTAAEAEVPINENFETLSAAGILGKRHPVTTGLTWGYYGGLYNGNTVADGTVTLTDAATNYVVVDRASGAVSTSTSTTNYNNTTDFARLYVVTTSGGVVTATIDGRMDEGGLLNGGGAGGGGGGGTDETALSVHTQTRQQSGTYLGRDGTFRDPLLVGTGVLSSVGSASDITNDSKYNAWPSICRIAGGKVMINYTKGDSHHADVTGVAKSKVGVESPDGTIAWGSEVTIFDHASRWVSGGYGTAQISTGRIFASIWDDTGSGSTDGRASVCYSDDEGATWSAPVSLHSASGFTLASYTSGPVVELPNGDLLVSVEGYDSAETYVNSDVKVVRSTDGGLTWGSVVLVGGTNGTPRPYYESHLVLLRSGRLLCVHRTSDSPGDHYIQSSDDYGATWGSPYLAFEGYGKPHTIQTSAGTLISITRRNSDQCVIAYTSVDDGVTWGAAQLVESSTDNMMYGTPVELLNGKILIVYSLERSGSDADVVQRIATEDMLNLRMPPQSIAFAVTDEATSITAGTSKIKFRNPFDRAFRVTGIKGSLSTAQATDGAGGIFTADVNVGGSTILSTKLTIDNTETTSKTATAPAVLSASSIAADAEIAVDIDQVGDGTAKGFKVYLLGYPLG
jgi:hypothetical protein